PCSRTGRPGSPPGRATAASRPGRRRAWRARAATPRRRRNARASPGAACARPVRPPRCQRSLCIAPPYNALTRANEPSLSRPAPTGPVAVRRPRGRPRRGPGGPGPARPGRPGLLLLVEGPHALAHPVADGVLGDVQEDHVDRPLHRRAAERAAERVRRQGVRVLVPPG